MLVKPLKFREGFVFTRDNAIDFSKELDPKSKVGRTQMLHRVFRGNDLDPQVRRDVVTHTKSLVLCGHFKHHLKACEDVFLARGKTREAEGLWSKGAYIVKVSFEDRIARKKELPEHLGSIGDPSKSGTTRIGNQPNGSDFYFFDRGVKFPRIDGVVSCNEQGTLKESPAIVMELMNGLSLREAIGLLHSKSLDPSFHHRSTSDKLDSNGKRSPWEELLDTYSYKDKVIIQNALRVELLHAIKKLPKALKDLEKRGIVLTDIQPSNIMLNIENGVVTGVFIDVSEYFDREFDRKRELVYTAGYAPSEVINQESIDSKVGVFSIGTVLYELFTGEKFFAGEGKRVPNAAVRKGQIPTFDKGVPGKFAEIVKGSLQPKPVDRPSVSNLYRLYSEMLRGLPDSNN